MPTIDKGNSGFTMIELLVSMAVFSFMLLIISSGVIGIVRMENQSLASNSAQDNARSTMDELVQAIRDSSGVTTPATVGVPTSILCLKNDSGVQQAYYVNADVLYRSDDCLAYTNTVALTSNQVQVSKFSATVTTGGAGITENEVEIELTIASDNGTTNGGGTACNNSDVDRQFCSVVTLTSGAVPR
jgi:prepilin-type N-terminal cleavage/methylation domain-containing protein